MTREGSRGPDDRAGGWTGAVRRRALRAFPPERLLPTTQPEYVASWIYVFGVLTLSGLVVVVLTGCVLALRGPAWWHVSDVGRYVNSLHLWSVELFMFFMIVHLWGQFFMAAWRGRRALTWIIGAVVLLVSMGTALTGYLVQQNFDSQWIADQAKDGLNSVGVGAWFNVLDFGQMLMWHIVLLPLTVSVLAAWHILLVRLRGVVPPIGATPEPVPAEPAESVGPVGPKGPAGPVGPVGGGGAG
ncbi:cytochrome b N-terminal domain-containing protein [Streptomyces sp. NPDC020490]|uniref:cytochrome b N-terminal domain-containing protein n=1 Tax=Streptomyces sp. NPDC020490 TaxID=3365078 RepID=UPI0037958D54